MQPMNGNEHKPMWCLLCLIDRFSDPLEISTVASHCCQLDYYELQSLCSLQRFGKLINNHSQDGLGLIDW